eukprot:scaffold46385_cov50-Attheya_sp.AAC.1
MGLGVFFVGRLRLYLAYELCRPMTTQHYQHLFDPDDHGARRATNIAYQVASRERSQRQGVLEQNSKQKPQGNND